MPSTLRQARDRVLEAGLWLVSRRPRQDALTAVLGALGALERATALREHHTAARDHLIEAALWLVAGRDREDVARTLVYALEALEAGGGAPEREAGAAPLADTDLLPELWRHRLHAWRGRGGSSAITALADRILGDAAAGRAALGAQRIAFAFRDSDDDATDALPGWRLALEIDNGAHTTVIAAADFHAIEQDVRWVSGPDELLGLVGGRPLRVAGSLVYARRAVRYQTIRDELLLPFGGIRLKVEAT